jgi:hypothetical protein
VQVAGTQAAPSATARTPLGSGQLGSSSEIAGGPNSAANSAGTAQAGGGNNADHSAGTVQAGGVTTEPTLALTDTPAGDASLNGPARISEGDNDATGSVGTVQVGGGNNADDSAGAVQAGGVSAGPSPTDTPAPGGDTANKSAGTVQAGGAPAAPGSSGKPEATKGASTRPVAPATSVAGRRYAKPPATVDCTTAMIEPRRAEMQLSFTGLGFALLLALGVGLALGGRGVRTRAER